MRIYLAASFERIDQMREVRDELHQMGHVVTSRWLNHSHTLDHYATDEQRRILGDEDIVDLEDSNAMIAFTEPPNSPRGRGGRHVELGYALAYQEYGAASSFGIHVVGFRENVFCYQAQVKFWPTWEHCKKYFAALAISEPPVRAEVMPELTPLPITDSRTPAEKRAESRKRD